MKRVLVVFAAAALASAAPTFKTDAASQAAQTAPPVEQGFTSLFNGQNLDGWRIGGPAESFKVENAAIAANGAASHAYYDGPVLNHLFKDFDLKLDVMAKARSNGGIYILTEYQPSGFPAKGFEVQLNNSHTDRIRTGSLYHVVDLSYVPAKDDEWFPMEIVVKGLTITVFVKNAIVLQWTQPPDWNGSFDFTGRRIAPGTIAFQAHDPGSFTYYRNIRIRGL